MSDDELKDVWSSLSSESRATLIEIVSSSRLVLVETSVWCELENHGLVRNGGILTKKGQELLDWLTENV